MNSKNLYVPFLMIFFLFSAPLHPLVQNPGNQRVQIEIPTPPHLEPDAIQTQPDIRINQTSTNHKNLLAPSGVISSVFGTGDNQVHGLIYYSGSLWASTRTSPARILRINPSTLAVDNDNRFQLASGQNDAEDIAAGNGYVWTILYTNPAQLIGINPATNTVQTVFTFNDPGKILAFGVSLKYAFGYLWAGGANYLARIDISNPLSPTYQIFDFSSLATKSYVLLSALTYSSDRLWGVFSQYDLNQPLHPFASTIIKINPASPAAGYVTNTVSTLFPDDITYAGTHFYTSSENQTNLQLPSFLFLFEDNLSAYTSTQVSDHASYGTFLDPYELTSIWGVYINSPGKIIKFDLNGNVFTSVTLPYGFNDPSEMAFDAAGNMYVSTWQSPAGIVKYPFKVFHIINLPLIVRNQSQ